MRRAGRPAASGTRAAAPTRGRGRGRRPRRPARPRTGRRGAASGSAGIARVGARGAIATRASAARPLPYCDAAGARWPPRAAVGHLARGRIALVGILGRRAGDDVVEGPDELAARRARGMRRRVGDVRPQLGHVAVLGVRDLAGQHLVQDAAERVDVRAPVDRVALDLLRGDVVGRPDPGAGRVRSSASTRDAWSARSRSGRRARLSPSPQIRMFAGLTSRWTRPAACAASSAPAIWVRMIRPTRPSVHAGRGR